MCQNLVSLFERSVGSGVLHIKNNRIEYTTECERFIKTLRLGQVTRDINAIAGILLSELNNRHFYLYASSMCFEAILCVSENVDGDPVYIEEETVVGRTFQELLVNMHEYLRRQNEGNI